MSALLTTAAVELLPYAAMFAGVIYLRLKP